MRTLSIHTFSHIAYDDLTQLIYLPAGIRLVAVAICGWVGVLGIMLGWVFCHLYGDEKTFLECLLLGLISGSTAYAALLFWQLCYKIDYALEGLTSKLVIALVLITAVFSAFVRYVYLSSIDPTIPFLSVFFIGLCGDILGSFIVLYAIKGVVYLLKRYSVL
jgi:hypothetical protein